MIHYFFLALRLVLLYRTLGSYVMAQFTPSCYLPDGSVDTTGVTPCDASATFSHCCNTRDLCLANGYCFGILWSDVYRSSCTDPSFEDLSCPYYCSDDKSALLLPL
jgi:hypothetical protein